MKISKPSPKDNSSGSKGPCPKIPHEYHFSITTQRPSPEDTEEKKSTELVTDYQFGYQLPN